MRDAARTARAEDQSRRRRDDDRRQRGGPGRVAVKQERRDQQHSERRRGEAAGVAPLGDAGGELRRERDRRAGAESHSRDGREKNAVLASRNDHATDSANETAPIAATIARRRHVGRGSAKRIASGQTR